MTDPSDEHDGSGTARAIDLAQEVPFTLGSVTVTPAALIVSAGSWSQRLEPRAMQVLVVLAQAAPAVVGRATLNRRVWAGRVVGEDAINRAVQLLRRLAADAPPPAPFAIETVPRVGYRLTVALTIDLAAPAAAPRPAPSPVRLWPWLAGAPLVMLAAAGAWWATSRTSSASWHVTGSVALDGLPPDARDVTLSPDGRRLAYRGQDGTRERIFVRRADGGGPGVAVSPATIDARRPAWSPDGGRIAFVQYDAGAPCALFVVRPGVAASPVGTCETVREPQLAWSGDGASLIFGDTPGVNAVLRIGAIRIADRRRTVLSSPPGDSLGDDMPVSRARDIVFRRLFGWADEGWVARDAGTGAERILWRRRGVAGSVAAPLPDGALAVAWIRDGASGLDIVNADGRTHAEQVAIGAVTALSAAGDRLLIETDQTESTLARAGGGTALATVRGRIVSPTLLPDGLLRFAVTAMGTSRIYEQDGAGSVHPWSDFRAAQIVGLAPSRDGRSTAALVTGRDGRAIALFDATGQAIFRWNPRSRSLNPAAWSADGRKLVVPSLDGAGWRLFALDPFGRAPPRDLQLPGFAVVQESGAALYAVRAGEATGGRELWRIDGVPRRLPIDLTLLDIVNWRAVDQGVWIPDRRERERPRIVLHNINEGRALRSLDAPGLGGPASGLAADRRGPVYVKISRNAPDYVLLKLSESGRQGSR